MCLFIFFSSKMIECIEKIDKIYDLKINVVNFQLW